MKIEGKSYKTIWFENNLVKIIDQTKLPHLFIIKDLKTVKDAIYAIKSMEVRGAPLIGATAAYGLVLSIIENNDLSFLKKSSEELIVSRPTAINLKWAVDRMMKKLSGVNDKDILKIALDEAKEITEEDEKFSTWLKESLNNDTIEKINLSDSYLENDIGCVVSSKFGMTGNMERIMKSQPLNDNRTMGFMKGKQIWELNINHSLVKQLREKYNTTPDEKPASLLKTLYQCCLLTSGYTIENPSEFVQSVVPNLSVV